jgi:hypothetical protein
MVNGGKRFDETVLNCAKLAKRQIALVELSIKQLSHRKFLDQTLDAGRSGIDERPCGAFDGIREHQYGGFACLRFGAWVSEASLIHFAAARIGLLLLIRTPVKVFH